VIRLEETLDRQIYTITESRAALGPPPRLRGLSGQLAYTGMYLESDLRTPRFDGPIDLPGEHHVVVKSGQRLTCQIVPAHPFDAIGWSGALYPYALNMADLTPMTGRVHTTPDVYQIFESDGVYISAITPMRLPDHPDSTPAQPDHLSDWDEIFHRVGRDGPDGYDAGSVTLHTRANPHGAALALKERSRRETTTGYGFIIDAARPVALARSAMPADAEEYFKSWAVNGA
jgi:homogentisate 1,2-dioxygenase